MFMVYHHHWTEGWTSEELVTPKDHSRLQLFCNESIFLIPGTLP